MKQTPSSISPKANKILLVTNILLFFGALALAVLNLDVKEYVSAAALLLVMFLTGANIYGCWKRLQRS